MEKNDTVPGAEAVRRVLDENGITYVVDEEGDLCAPWQTFRTYFMFSDVGGQRVFSVRAFYDRPHGVEDETQLLRTVDEWNRDTLWPKVYTYAREDGSSQLVGEVHLLIGPGCDETQFAVSTGSWVAACIEFDEWLGRKLGLAQPDAGLDEENGPERESAVR
ncbi:YbjN domain-containing protein [Streptomyces sp. NPDC057271]|uniref:YbjN domain-containing protein n=1 Tax=unclassified Streptomyces TaxID=2593676 RepID=UPI00362DE0B4